MGWAKYAEDNFEIHLERMDIIHNDSARKQMTEIEPHFFEEQTSKKNDGFSQRLTGKSYFSLH